MVARDDARQIGRGAEHHWIGLRAGERTIVDESHDAVREIVLREDLAGDGVGERAGTDDQDPLFEVRVTREALEGQAPERDSDEQQTQRRDEDAVADEDRGHHDRHHRQHHSRRAGCLEDVDHQLGFGVDDCQVV